MKSVFTQVYPLPVRRQSMDMNFPHKTQRHARAHAAAHSGHTAPLAWLHALHACTPTGRLSARITLLGGQGAAASVLARGAFSPEQALRLRGGERPADNHSGGHGENAVNLTGSINRKGHRVNRSMPPATHSHGSQAAPKNINRGAL
jgi:hypothetical protein